MKNKVFGIMLLIVICFGMSTTIAKASANLSVTISPPSPLIMVKATSKVFTATVAGGTSPYQFFWTLYDNLKVPVASGTGNPWNCTVPGDAFVGIGNVTVYVTDSQGDIGFTFEPVLILALYVSVSPAPATLDAGQPQAFSSSVLGGTSPYSYQWYLDGSSMSGANGASWTYTPSSSGSHAVYVSVKDGASDAATSNTVLVTVNAALSTSISPTSVTLDVDQSQTFTSSTSGGTSSFTYQWYLDSSAVPGATSSSWICSPPEAGLHTVCVKVTDCASTPVTAPSNTASVIVNSAPSVIISPTSATMDIGQSKQFTSSTYGGTSPFSYEWYVNGTAISGVTSSSYTFTPSSKGHYNFYCNITDSANVRAQSNTATVVVNSALSVSISQPSVTLDVGQSQTLTSTITGGTPPYAYQWCMNSSSIGGAIGASYTFRPSSRGNYTFYLNVTDGANSEARSSIVTVTVNSALLVKISPTSVTLDVDQSQNFSSSTSAGTSPYSYQWYLNGSAVRDATSSTWTFAPISSGSYSVYLNVTDSVGMKVKSEVVTVTVNIALFVSISPTAVVVDVGQSQTFTSAGSGGTLPYTYQWYLNGVIESGVTSASWTFTPSSMGSYTVCVKVTDSASASTTSNTATITVNSAPSVSISLSAATLDVGQSQTFTSSVSGGTSPYSYQWYLNDAAVSGATSSTWTFTPSSSGSYSVLVNVTDTVGFEVRSNVATVIVNTAPSVSISPGSTTLDVGQSQDFTSSVSGGTGSHSYQWYLDGTPVSSAKGATWSFAPSAAGSYNVHVVITDSLGVNATSSAATVTVNSALFVTASPSSVLMDVGQSELFTSSVRGGTFPYSCQWYLNGQAVGTGVTYNFSQSVGSDSIYVTVTDSASSSYTATSNTAIVTVNSALSVDVSPSFGAMDVGQSQLFTSSVSNGTSPYYYQWYFDGVAVGTNSATWNFTFTSTGTFMVRVNVTDYVGLFASGTATVIVKSHDVAVTNVTPFKPQIVEGGSINVNITVKNEGNYTETFNVTLYESLHGYSSPIYTFTNVTLAPGSTTTLTIVGLGLGLGFYTLSADVYNAYFSNTYTGGTVCVMTLAGLRLWNWICQGSYSSWRYGLAIPV